MAAPKPVDINPPGSTLPTGMTAGADMLDIEQRLHDRVQEIVEQIEIAKAQIAAVRPHEISSRDIRAVAGQLDAVGRDAENAVASFLDAAEHLGDIAGHLPDEHSGEVQKIATQIFEASNFHDITGQRITQAMRVLNQIETKISALSDVLHNGALALPQDDAAAVAAAEPAAGEPPLDGPDPSREANRQDDIDALFDSLD